LKLWHETLFRVLVCFNKRETEFRATGLYGNAKTAAKFSKNLTAVDDYLLV